MGDNNVLNFFGRPGDNKDNIFNVGGTTDFTEDAIIKVAGKASLGELDYCARWAEFVRGVFAGGGRVVSTSAANYTVTAADFLILADATSNEIDINLPPAADFYDAVNDIGYTLTVKKIDAIGNDVDLVATIPETVENVAKITLSGEFDDFTIISAKTTWWVV